jgi:hypothetical protein
VYLLLWIAVNIVTPMMPPDDQDKIDMVPAAPRRNEGTERASAATRP